ncbi:MAG: radical SAM protein [Deltaproteobacteria bacterium]|nr:radical SAM protein [Deltaproteobacteria bacterium]
MAKAVLVHAPLKNVLGAATPDYVDENRGANPPMGLLYLKAALNRSAHESAFLDANLEGLDHRQAARRALSHQPDLIGIQAMTHTMPDACLLAKEIKAASPGTAVMIGGPHPTIYPEETAALPYVDFAFAGEGEEGLITFLDRFDDPEARLSVPGVAGKKDGNVVYTPSAGLLSDLDAVPIPARRDTPYDRYTSVLAQKNPIAIMITSRGCPFSCVFCNRMGRKYRAHSADRVLAEFDDVVSLGVGEVFIHDDTFSLDRKRVVDICQGLMERGAPVVWEARTRVDRVDPELLALMKKAGCARLSFGVESGSPRVLAAMKKGTTPDQARAAFSWCRAAGITTLADFMVGNLEETEEDIQQTLDLLKDLDPDYAQFSICSPYPNTPLYQLALDQGVVKSDVWRAFAADPLAPFESPAWTAHFSREELDAICARAYRKFYFRPRFILRQAKKIRSPETLFTMARGALGMLKGGR